ncbi:hypothetical protein GHT06_022581 [Daphnia sinensis]|uniref:Uncharacterized protein n=1 Tax=Daphnia sinensis TaxID=1820382 RepID=A0AAD5PMM1_9CRUS|nr:hypothetical protein GHT06_022581 [Daphnia sinensis]
MGFLNQSTKLTASKVDRQFSKFGKQLAEEISSLKGLGYLAFDGRKDKTLVRENSIQSFTREEHIVVLSQPGSRYVDHFTPISGKAIDIAKQLFRIVEATESVNTLDVKLPDGTAVNTGCANGAIRLLELHLNRPLQRAICQLHLNELPFRHIFKELDGKTTGPSSYFGCIVRGRVKQIPDAVTNQFTGDQKYLYDICLAVQTGIIPTGLELRSPGKLSEARWLTKANRILRLYISTEKPTDKLNRYI